MRQIAAASGGIIPTPHRHVLRLLFQRDAQAHRYKFEEYVCDVELQRLNACLCQLFRQNTPTPL